MSTKEQFEEDFLNQEAMERKWRDEFENSFPTMDFSYSNLFYKDGEVNRYWAIYITAKRLAQIEIDTLTSQLEKAESVMKFYETEENYSYKENKSINYMWNDQGKRAREYFKNKEQL